MTAAATAWPDLARCLADRLVVEAESCRRHVIELAASQAGEGRRWGLAVSGGADSVCLALLAWASLPEQRSHWTVLHFNHQRRGAASDGDEVFVKKLAEGLGIGFLSGHPRRPSVEPASEATLREERLAFFRASGCGIILQGHQRDDILETQLMRLCRGSGTGGLAAPRRLSRHRDGLVFLRPLLGLGREAIRATLRACAVPWREDASNDTGDFLRNRIRREVVPALQEASDREPGVGAALSRELLEEDAEALDLLVQELFPQGFSGPVLEMPDLRTMPRAVLRRAFHQWLGQHGLSAERAQMEALLAAAQDGAETILTLAPAQRVAVSRQAARWLDEDSVETWPLVTLPLDEARQGPGGSVLARRVAMDDALRARIRSGQVATAHECFLAIEKGEAAEIRIRSWEPGDRYRPLGAPGTRKVAAMFIDAKIPQRERKQRPLVFWGGDLVWVPGFPPAEYRRIDSRTEWALWLTYRPA